MKKVYLDNAATTALRAEVITEITTVLTENYGNPSSTHSFGRQAKNVLELSRKKIAKAINATASEILFTSGGTEANNWILTSCVKDLKIERIITTKVEHHAVLHTIEELKNEFGIAICYLKVDSNGTIDYTELATILSHKKPTLVSLMHVNNETGTMLDIERVGVICKEHQAYFHSDTVQSMGKTSFDLQNTTVDFLVASAHKFHGPKGIGFAYIRKGIAIKPIIYGGEQEKGLRAGTESLHNIVGMATALELANLTLERDKEYISGLKTYLTNQLLQVFPSVKFNGGLTTFYTICNILLPISEEKSALLLFHLDMKGIAISKGSACQSGSSKPSHVLAELLDEIDLSKPSLRISFSHTNTKEDIDSLIEALQAI